MRDEFSITVPGVGAGTYKASLLIGQDPGVHRGRVCAVRARFTSGDHVSTAWQIRLGMFPKNYPSPAAGFVLDLQGRPTIAQDVFTDIPDERVFYRNTPLAAGAVSAQVDFLADDLTDANRRLSEGPYSATIQNTVTGGNTSTFLISVEYKHEPRT